MRLQRRCANDDVVADVLQETYLAVWRAADGFKRWEKATTFEALSWSRRRTVGSTAYPLVAMNS